MSNVWLAFVVLLLSSSVYAATYGPFANPVAVSLGAAGNYVALAETTITTNGATAIVGDLGLSNGVGDSAYSGFGQYMDPLGSGQFSLSSLVNGKLYAVDYAPPTPSNIGTAITNMGTAYTTGYLEGNPTTPDEIDINGGNLGGQSLGRGVYRFDEDVHINGGNLTLFGGPNDVWIFQISGTLDDGADLADEHIVLTGGAQASNVFWMVAGETTIYPGSTFNGIILDQTGIAMQDGATFNGKALAQSAVTLIGDAVLLPALPVTSISNVTSNVTSCMNISSGGAYRLTNDLSGAPIDASPLNGTACVKINSSNVLLDCNAFRITNNGTGGTTYGILLANTASNVTVINCPHISRYSYGVEVFSSNNSVFNAVVVSNNTVNGFSVNGSVGTSISNAIARNNGAAFTFASTVGGTNTLANVTAHDNSGDVFGFTTTGPNTITNGFATNNGGHAFYFNSTGLNTITGNAVSGNLDAFTVLSAPSNTFSGNGVFSNTGAGTSVFNSTATLTNRHIYNNNPDFRVNGSNVTLVANIFDSPAGNFSHYTNLSLADTAGNSTYSIRWSAPPALALPANTTSFAGKFVIIANLTPSVSVSNITWNWLVTELGGYAPSQFTLWVDNGTAWSPVSATLNTAARTLSISSISNFGVYAILQNGTSKLVVTPVAPAAGSTIAVNTTTNTTNVTFTFIETDNMTAVNCSLILDGSVNASNSNVSNDTDTNFTVLGIYQGSHTWMVNCTDTSGNIGISVMRRFTVGTPAPPIPPSGGNHGAPQLSIGFSSSCSGNTVTVSSSGPVSGAEVKVNGDVRGTTDSNGQVSFTGCGNDVLIHASQSGYSDAYSTQSEVACGQCQNGGCGTSSDCPESQMCSNRQCVDVSCSNGQVVSHQCVPNQVTPPPPAQCNAPSCCNSSSQCGASEACSIPSGSATGSCQQVTGQCGYVANHAWVAYQCGAGSDCPQCTSGQNCMNNQCVPVGVSCIQSSGTVGTVVTCQLTENNQICADCNATITGPDGTVSIVSADANGNIQLHLTRTGSYQVSVGQTPMTAVTATAPAAVPPAQPTIQPTTQPTPASNGTSLIWLVAEIILVLIIAGLVVYWMTRTKK